MIVSAEIITTIVSVGGLVLALAGGFAWMLNRTDSKFEALEAKMDARFERIESDLRGVRHDLIEVKIAVARLEGPQRHLIPAR